MKLYPYQKEGIRALAARERFYLADEMGLGKTVQAILACKLARREDPSLDHIFVVCPASVVENWYAEFDKWGWDGGKYVTSYSSLIRKGRLVNEPNRKIVILDEAHYCKSPSAKRTKAALRLARNAKRAYLLSGTPMPNNPTELWPLFKYLWPEKLEPLGITTAVQWMNRFCKTRATEWGPKPYAVRNGAELRAMLDDMMLRRRLADVELDLPPLRVDTSYLPRNPELEKELKDYEQYDEGDPDMVYTSTLRRLLGRGKAPAIASQVVGELGEGAYKHIVVLYYHKEVGQTLRESFDEAGVSHVGFDGSTPKPMRQRAIEFFQNGNTKVFLAQQTSAGIGINLTRAREVVLVEPAWTPEDNAQAIKRIHRIGQAGACRARIFAVPGTIDAAIMGTLSQKTQMIADVFGD